MEMENNTITNSTGIPPPEASALWFLGIIVTLMITCIICNTFIVVVFIMEKSIRNEANMFVVSLACSDLVVGMVSIPLWIANSTPGIKLHYFHYSVDILCCSASIFSCALFSIERALKICFPFWYTNNVTSLRIKIVIVLGWIVAALVGSLSLVRGTDPKNIPYILFITIIIYALPVSAIVFSYISIFFVAHKHAKSIRKQTITSETTRMRISESKTAWRLSVFIIVFIICWTPLFIKIWGRIILPRGPPIYFNVLANTLTYLNAAVNPSLYAILNPLFRKGMAKLFKKKKDIDCIIESSSRRNELSTVQTNVNNSPSTGRAVSTHCSPRTGRHQPPFTHNDLWNDAYKTLLNNPHAECEDTNNGDDNKSCLYETSL